MSNRHLDAAWRVKLDDMEPAAKLVLLSLADHLNERTGQCNPSRQRLSERTGLDPRTVTRAIRYLEAKGVVRVERRDGLGSHYLLGFLLEGTTEDPGHYATSDIAPPVTLCLPTGGNTPPPPVASRQRTGGITPPGTRKNQKVNQNRTVLPPPTPAAGELPLGVEPESMPPPKPKAHRERNPLFDALAELDGGADNLTGAAAGAVGKALSEMMKASPDLTPDEIGRRAGTLILHFPNATATASSLAKHWARCAKPPEVRPVNGYATRQQIEVLEEQVRRHPGNPAALSYDRDTLSDEQSRDFQA